MLAVYFQWNRQPQSDLSNQVYDEIVPHWMVPGSDKSFNLTPSSWWTQKYVTAYAINLIPYS